MFGESHASVSEGEWGVRGGFVRRPEDSARPRIEALLRDAGVARQVGDALRRRRGAGGEETMLPWMRACLQSD